MSVPGRNGIRTRPVGHDTKAAEQVRCELVGSCDKSVARRRHGCRQRDNRGQVKAGDRQLHLKGPLKRAGEERTEAPIVLVPFPGSP